MSEIIGSKSLGSRGLRSGSLAALGVWVSIGAALAQTSPLTTPVQAVATASAQTAAALDKIDVASPTSAATAPSTAVEPATASLAIAPVESVPAVAAETPPAAPAATVPDAPQVAIAKPEGAPPAAAPTVSNPPAEPPPTVAMSPAPVPAEAVAVPSAGPTASPPVRSPPTQAAGVADPAVTRLLAILAEGAAAAKSSRAEDRAALASFYNENGGRPVWTSLGALTARGSAAVAEIGRAGDYGLDAAVFDLPADTPAATVEAQAQAELTIGLSALRYARQARGGRVDPTTISRLIDMRPTLPDPAKVIRAVAASDDAAGALRGYHPQHAGFQKLVPALTAARSAKAPVETVQRILVNMERWRWMPEDLGAFYVWDNVPEQMTRVMSKGEPVLTEKIVVGKANTPTPLFTANMLYVIFHPSWGVPEGIKTNEVGPMLRRASASGGSWFGDSSRAGAALARHNLSVMHNGRVVNPDSVDWTAVNIREFQFTQPPSGRNVLGVVKFRFPNRHDVYMHDTPERHLFSSAVRAFSHGCMRVQNPLHLAEVLLAHDKGWSKDKVNGFVGRGNTADITLDKPIPVHITYFTASADETGKLHLHGDIYGMDQRVASALAGKTVHLAAQAPASVPASRSAATRVPTRTARSQAGSSFANPFAGLFAN